MESKSTESESKLEVIGRDDNRDFIVKHHPTGNIVKISDTYAEMFSIVETSPEVPHNTRFYEI